MNRLQLFLSVFYVFLFCVVGSAQQNRDKKEHYLFFDEITGIENSDLHNGIIYKEEHRIKNKKTKFFPQPDFVLGSVVYNGQPYFDIQLKYNVYDDELLMLTDKDVGGNTLQLYKPLVDGFSIGEYRFTKVDDPAMTIGYYEVALEKPDFSFLKKHRKTIKQLLGGTSVFYEFEEGEKEGFIHYQNKYFKLENSADLTLIFPKHETELNTFYKKLNSDTSIDNRLESLLEYLNTLLSNENDKLPGN